MDQSACRVTRSKADARRNYNRLSRWYDFLAGRSEEPYRRIGFELLSLKPGEAVLEIGFGTGHSLVQFSNDVGMNGLVIGIDISDGMAEETQKRLKVSDKNDRIGIILADGAHLPFCCEIYNAVFTSFTLELFDTPEILTVLRQCQRVMHPGGKLVVVTMVKSLEPKIPEQIYEWFHTKMPVLVDCRPIPAQYYIQKAGFQIKQVVKKFMWGLPVEIIIANKPKR